MQVEVSVPALLTDFTNGKRSFQVEAETVDGVIVRMLEDYPLLRSQLFDEGGVLRRHIVIFHNGESIAFIEPRMTPVENGDTLDVLQAVSGG